MIYNSSGSSLPCKKGNILHMKAPNTKSLFSVPTSVKGMQRTPKNRSEMAKLSRNTLVIVRIRLFCTSVKITSEFPMTARRKMTAYNGICTLLIADQLAELAFPGVVDATNRVATVVVVVEPPISTVPSPESAAAVIARKRLIVTLCANEAAEEEEEDN